MIDAQTMAELERACQAAIDMAEAYGDVIRAQAEAHDLEATALRRYVNARVRDRLDKLKAEQQTIDQLELQFDVRHP